jgi:hypothetical protein
MLSGLVWERNCKIFWKILQKRINHKDFQLSTELNYKKSDFRA